MKDSSSVTGVSFENILGRCKTSSEAIALLYEERKSVDNKFSLAKICSTSGIPSRGYLVSVMKGRRTISLKYRNPIARSFRLQGVQSKFLKTLIDLDHEKNTEQLGILNKRLTRYRKSMSFIRPIVPGAMPNLPMVVEVFAAFGLFGNRAMEEDIVGYFGPQSARKVVKALDALLQCELIKVDGIHFQINQENVMFSGGEDGISHLDFIKYGLKESHKAVDLWFNHPEISHFESSLVSVKRDQLISILPMIKSYLNESRSRLETNSADTLLHFSVQIFPVREK